MEKNAMAKVTQETTKQAIAIQWHPDLRSAMNKAKAEAEYILLDFYNPS
jgi:hypothetical protein